MNAIIGCQDRLNAERLYRILVIDDEPEIQAVLGDLLTEVGYAVETASSSEEALTAVAQQTYDLVISDLRLPGCSGAQLVEEIVRRRPGLANRIVLFTGELNAGSARLPVIRKPFDVDAVLTVVQERIAVA